MQRAHHQSRNQAHCLRMPECFYPRISTLEGLELFLIYQLQVDCLGKSLSQSSDIGNILIYALYDVDSGTSLKASIIQLRHRNI